MNNNNKTGYQLLDVIKQAAKEYIDSTVPLERVFLMLFSVDPLEFINTSNDIRVKGKMLITPRYRVFKESELGTQFLFLKMDDANKYVYLYEPAPAGENGERYVDSVDIDGFRDGSGGVVTGGKVTRDGGGW